MARRRAATTQGTQSNLGRKRRRGGRRRRTNPAGTTAAIVALVAVGGAALGFGIRHIVRKRREQDAKELPPSQVLADFIQDGATLGEAPAVVADVLQPVNLSVDPEPPATYDHVMRLRSSYVGPDVGGGGIIGTGPAGNLEHASFGTGPGGVLEENSLAGRLTDGNETNVEYPVKAIATLVTDIPGDLAHRAYELALVRIAEGTNWSLDADRAIAVRSVLRSLIPTVDWNAVQPFSIDPADPVARIWDAVDLVGAVAHQSYWNKQAQQVPVPPLPGEPVPPTEYPPLPPAPQPGVGLPDLPGFAP